MWVETKTVMFFLENVRVPHPKTMHINIVNVLHPPGHKTLAIIVQMQQDTTITSCLDLVRSQVSVKILKRTQLITMSIDKIDSFSANLEVPKLGNAACLI